MSLILWSSSKAKSSKTACTGDILRQSPFFSRHVRTVRSCSKNGLFLVSHPVQAVYNRAILRITSSAPSRFASRTTSTFVLEKWAFPCLSSRTGCFTNAHNLPKYCLSIVWSRKCFAKQFRLALCLHSFFHGKVGRYACAWGRGCFVPYFVHCVS